MSQSLPGLPAPDQERQLAEVRMILARQRRVTGLVHQQQMRRHDLVEGLVHRQNLAEMEAWLRRLGDEEIARILERLAEPDRIDLWRQVDEGRCDSVLEALADEFRESLLASRPLPSVRDMLNVFVLREGRLIRTEVEARSDLEGIDPVWIDLVAPSEGLRRWVSRHFGVDLPDPHRLTDIEASARFFVDDGGGLHLRCDFLLDAADRARSVPVGFICQGTTLFSIRNEELPVFRLQRLRARAQSGYVSDAMDVLLDLHAADVEYSADSLEALYQDFDRIGNEVLNPHVSDEEAAHVLAEIARGEDLNGRIRRNLLDTRRALSFLTRSRSLSPGQHDDAREIVRDIESLDMHTSYLFGKLNFLMDSTIGFININQNKKVSRLTTIGVVFTPINVIAGIGGMSEFSMMTKDTPWPIAYGAFVGAMLLIGGIAYVLLRRQEQRRNRAVATGR